MESGTVRKVRRLRAALTIAAALGPGCGRVVPEGYALIDVQLGRRAPSAARLAALQPSGAALATTCQVPRFAVAAVGPDIPMPPPVAPVVATVDDINEIVEGSSGTLLFTSEPAQLLVKKGFPRRFITSGVIYGDCSASGPSYAFPIFGLSQEFAVGEPMSITIGTKVAGSYFQAAGIANGISTANTGLVSLTVTWSSLPAIGGSSCPTSASDLAVITAHDVPQNFDMRFSDSTATACVAHQIGPLLPERQYQINYRLKGVDQAVYCKTFNVRTGPVSSAVTFPSGFSPCS
jgi:hypothetical protein